MPPEPWALLLLGLLSGASWCSLSCLPYLAPYLMGTGRGFRDGLRASALFMGGKLLVYALWGGLAGYGGRSLAAAGAAAPGWAAGLLLIVVAFTLLWARSAGCGGEAGCRTRKLSLVGLGMGSSLQPCPTLAAVLVLAAGQGTVLGGVACGALFGLGLGLSPLLLIGGGLARIGARLQLQGGRLLPVLRGVAALSMVGLGLRLMVG